MLFKKIDAASADSISSGFDFFGVPDTDVSLSKSDYKEILTLNPVNQPPYHKKVLSGSSYLDFSKCYLLIDGVIQKSTNGGAWENVEAADNISTCQCPALSCLKNVKLSINGRQVYNSNNLQPYKNYMDLMLSFNPDVKRSYLALSGYYEDGTSLTSGTGHEARRDLFTDGKVAQFITKLNIDLFNQDRYFVNNAEIDIEIQPSESDFMIVAPTLAANVIARFKITNIKLYVKCLDAMDGVSLSITRVLEKMPIRYPLKSSNLKTLSLEAGRTEVNFNVFTELIPSSIAVMMVDTPAYNGDPKTSPFEAKHFNISDIRMLWNGQQTPSVPYELRFDQGRVARAYHDLYENTGLAWGPHTNGITLKKFINGYTFFVFNLTSNLENNTNFNLLKDGITSVYMRFREPIPRDGVTVIFYASYDSLVNVDKNRTVTTDVSV